MFFVAGVQMYQRTILNLGEKFMMWNERDK